MPTDRAQAFVSCGHPGCDWSQLALSENAATYLGRRHELDAHGAKENGAGFDVLVTYSSGPWRPPRFRPTAIDYELARD